MARIIKRNKALSVNPVKSSQPLGAILAFQGVSGAIPLLHGSQGCTAFAKVFFVRHFNEPIPLQTTAMDQISTVQGGDGNVEQAILHLAKDRRVRAIGLLTTGLTEVQGVDIHRVVADLRKGHSELARLRVVAVNTPDFTGCLESGHAAAVTAMIRDWVPASPAPRRVESETPRLNILPGAHLTPGDLDLLKAMVAVFGMEATVIPDLATALDGHLGAERHAPVAVGGVDPEDFARLHQAKATLVIGHAQESAAALLRERTGVSNFHLPGLMGLAATDQLVMFLHAVSGRPVPISLERQRGRLLDAMLDTHFYLNNRDAALAGDPDWLLGWGALLGEVGVHAQAVVASVGTSQLAESRFETVKIGDLEDLEERVAAEPPQWFIGNSHLVDLAGRHGASVIRSGYPLFDWLGGQALCRIGYEGARQTLFEMANAAVHAGQHRRQPYRSRYAA
ncbi:MAG: nitrogenase iron-molybdenum cofactor biosynthesis protein NifN [Magnetococcales bacterium]|nr:nitrogenase iron-molybdenum cofactor biosynthesis protein NifN [Magnetococcales bacterium]